MSKTKSSKVAAPSKAKDLKKVKQGGVTKPAQNDKAKSKEIAKNVAVKEEKKSKKDKKKVVKEPTPESSSSEEEENSSESESSESEVEVKKATTNGKAKPAPKDESSDSESDSSSEDEAPAPKKGAAKTNGVKVPAKKEESSDSESDSDEETPAAVLGVAPPVDQADSSDESESSDEEDAGVKTNGAAKEDSEDSDSDSSDSESESEKEEPAAKVNKRKAEEQPERAIKKAKAEADESANPASTNLFVGNLSWNVDDELLRSTFEEYGELTRVQVMYDRATNRAKGFGYVEFAKAEDAAAAYEAKKGFELDGRAMNVDYSSRKPADGQKQEDRRKSFGDQLSPPTATLFVGNIAWDAGQEQVSEAFSPYGTILSVRLPTDQESGQPKGFGYVTFSSVDEATAAIEAMQGAYISSRPIRLDYGAERTDRGDGGSGGRGRGRGGFGGGRGRGGDRGRGGRGGGRGFGDRGGRGGRGGSTNRGGFGDFSGRKQTFD